MDGQNIRQRYVDCIEPVINELALVLKCKQSEVFSRIDGLIKRENRLASDIQTLTKKIEEVRKIISKFNL
jgi:hypothetical protein